jgi:hypothetical protein
VEVKNYESEVEGKIEEWNARIEQLKISAQDAGPEKSKEYEEEIDTLIADREAVRRGLLRMSESGEALCSSCPDEPAPSEKTEPEKVEPVEESILERIAPEPYDVGRSPRKTYGKGD